MAGTILYKLSLDATQFKTGLNNAMKSLDKVAKQMQKVGEDMTKYVSVPLAAAGVASVMAWDQSAKALAQVEAGVKSTGGIAGFTTKQLAGMAEQLTDISRLDDDEILSKLTAQLLTFTNIAGKQFELAQVAALNLSARLDGDLQSAAIMVGKALNDPVKGLTAMGRAGVQFTESQKETIKALWETGQAAAAQNMILAELEKQYGGSSEATLVGAGNVIQLKNSLGNLSEEFGRIIMEGISPFIDFLRDMVKGFMDLSEGTKKTIVIIGSLAAAIGPVMLAIAGLMQVTKTLAIVFAAVNWEIVLVVGAIAALVAAATYLWQNWQAVSERISDWSWWRNMLIDMVKFLAQTAQGMLDVLTWPIRKMAEMFGVHIPTIVESLDPLMDKLDLLKTEPKEYKTQFKGFWDSMKDGTKDAIKYFGLFKESAEKDLAGVGSSIGAVTGSMGSLGGRGSKMNPLNPIGVNSLPGGVDGNSLSSSLETSKLDEYVERVKKKAAEAQEAFKTAGMAVVDMGGVVRPALEDLFSGFGESLGDLLTGAGSMKSSFQNIMKVVSDFLGAFGKALIAAGVAKIAFDNLLLSGPAAIAAGVALVALSRVVSNVMNKGLSGGGSSSESYSGPTLQGAPKLAAGGLAYAPTLATVGDNVNAHVDPEVIAPLSKLQSVMGYGNGRSIPRIELFANGSTLKGVIMEEDLRAALMR